MDVPDSLPQPAVVEPRVFSRDSTDRLSLVAVIRQLLRRMEVGHVEIVGKPGGGKTTALRHLAHVFTNRTDLEFVDGSHHKAASYETRRFCIYTRDDTSDDGAGNAPRWMRLPDADDSRFLSLVLAPWCIDDWIEYLLARHPDACASVMARIRDNDDMRLLEGSPALCTLVLDALADRPDANDIPALLVEQLDARLPAGKLRDDAMKVALSHYFTPQETMLPDKPAERLKAAKLPSTLKALLQTETIQQYLASCRVRIDLRSRRLPKYFVRRIKPELIRTIAAAIEQEPKINERLRHAIESPLQDAYTATCAGILNATADGWRPIRGRHINLSGAYLVRAKWDRISFASSRLRHTDLSQASCREADLESCNFDDARLVGADLTGACLHDVSCNRTRFANAILRHCRAERSSFHLADLTRTDFTGANLKWASFIAAKCRATRFVRADLSHARLMTADLEDADFSNATLETAELRDVDFRKTTLHATSFRLAICTCCNFEDVNFSNAEFSAANLTGALFTGANMPNAIFKDADLRNAGLFEVNWENADLQAADLRGASFHAGSSRSGLVGSPIASEGTRTGFYTDEYLDQTFRAPEDIRVANLRGADLRGANIFETDFYLVDLRDAKYHRPQEEHLRKCGAILETRV